MSRSASPSTRHCATALLFVLLSASSRHIPTPCVAARRRSNSFPSTLPVGTVRLRRLFNISLSSFLSAYGRRISTDTHPRPWRPSPRPATRSRCLRLYGAILQKRSLTQKLRMYECYLGVLLLHIYIYIYIILQRMSLVHM